MPSLSSPPPPTGLHNLTSISAIHMPSSYSQPPPIGLHIPVVAPRAPSVPPSHIPFSSSSTPHTGLHTPSTDIGASPSPHTVPSPASIGGPSSVVGQQSAPSPIACDIVAPQPMVDLDLDAEPDPPLQDRPMIEPVGRGFVPSRVASQAITKTIKQQFLNPWPSWGSIPEKDKDIFWQRFKRRVQWALEHEIAIRRNFNSRASHRLSEMFRDARMARERPEWIPNDVWTRLLEHWNSPSYQSKYIAAKKNRAFETGGTLHTGGSITTYEHALRMARELGRHVFLDEVFQQTHIRKGTGEYVDEKSRKTNDDSIRTRCWIEIVGGKKKGRLYGAGQLVSKYVGPNESLNQLPPSSSSNIEDLTNIRQQLSRSLEENEQLRYEFRSFQSLVLQYLPPDAQACLQQP
ncbi:uncharacterized protein LOC114191155 [Vigna unguiculata]|uniref:uncharacterized protein LOC114191155 n=1 Tax=Vigna unguiculata TaxID=3917 RepID=UPI001016675A|nr:uncharacterized protein LOC114191155 [Vigna unguiculata]